MMLHKSWLNCLESRHKHLATDVTKTCWQGTEYKNKIIKFSSITLICVLADVFYFVYESGCLFFYDFVVFNILRICFLFSTNDVRPDPLISPGELSSQFLF